MLKHEYLNRIEYFQMKFWAKLFVWSAKSRKYRICCPRFVCDWFDKQMWKQLEKIPK